MRRTEQPSLDRHDAASEEARAALTAFVDELQRGLDERDADVYDASFAGDVLWGSPYGRVLKGREQLRAIHGRLLAEGRGGRSRYVIVQVVVPAAGVVVGHVRRMALDNDGEPVADGDDTLGSFSEMALYVLVERDGEWLLAAGQNTPVVRNPYEPA